MSFTQVPVVGTYYTPGGELASGTITFRLNSELRNDSVTAPGLVTVELVSGAVPGDVTLTALDDDGTTPTGASYHVIERVGGSVTAWDLIVSAADEQVDLATVDRAVAGTVAAAIYQPLSQRGVANGYAPLDADGLVPVDNLPAGDGGGGSAVSSVAGRTGDVVLVESDVTNLTTDLAGKAASSHTHAESDVTSLVSNLSAKAADNAVVHLTGAETVAGIKTFSSAPVVPSASFPESAVNGLTADLAAKATDTAVVHLTGAETIAGIKTFSSSPVVPSAAFPESAVSGLTTDLAAKATDTAVVHLTGAETIAGVKTFSSAPVVPSASFPESAVSGLTTDLSAKATDTAVVHLTGAETVAGVKTFSSAPVVPSASFPESAVSGLASDLSTLQSGIWLPSDNGFVAWSLDPEQAGSSTAPTAAGVMHVIKVKLGAAATIASCYLRITNTASGLSNSFVALYDSGGTRRAVSADQSTSWQSSGSKPVSFASSYSASVGTFYVGILVGTASTLPIFSRGSSSSVVNDGLTAATGFRASAHATTGLSATPTNLTLSTQTTNGANDVVDFWVALHT